MKLEDQVVSARGGLGVDEDGLVVHGVGVLRNGGELYVVLFPGNLRVDQQAELVVREVVVAPVGTAVQLLPPVAPTIHGRVDDVVFDRRLP